MENELEQKPRSGLTVRACIVGFALVALNTIWATFSEYYMRSSNMGTGLVPMSVFLPFFLMVGVVNVILKRISPRIAFTPQELLLIFVIAFVGNAGRGMNWLISVIATPNYFATTENKWEEYFFPYLAKWAIPNDKQAVRWFYDGLPQGESIPWSVWVRPLFWWLTFMVAGLVGSLCLSSILRKQWTDREKLNFALVEVPVQMVQNPPDEKSYVPAMYKQRIFWIGFAITFALVMWNVIAYFYPEFPQITIIKHRWRRIVRYFPHLYQRINPYVVGFSFFCPVDILFSIWFFYLLGCFQIYIYYRTGFTVGPQSEYSNPWQLTRLQGCGGYIFIALWAIWVARHHLWQVLKKAWNPQSELDDSDEFMSHRAAVIGFLLCLAYVVVFLHALGIEYRLVFVYIAIALTFTIGFGKLVAESGLVYFSGPFNAREFAEFAIGYTKVNPSSLTGLGLAHAWGTFGVMWFTHVAKVIDFIRAKRRSLSLLLIAVWIFSVIVGLWFVIHCGYKYGAYNSNTWVYRRGPVYYYNKIVTKMKQPVPIDWAKMGIVWIGAAITAFMTFMRYRFTWWRLHPIGFTVATMWATRIMALSVFFVWFVKVVFLNLGGVQFTRRLRPFFLGLLCGFAMGVLISFFIDWIWFPLEGHLVHF